MKTVIKWFRYYVTCRLLTSSTVLDIVVTYGYNYEVGTNDPIICVCFHGLIMNTDCFLSSYKYYLHIYFVLYCYLLSDHCLKTLVVHVVTFLS